MSRKTMMSAGKYIAISTCIIILLILFSLFLDSIFPLPSSESLMPEKVMLGDSATRNALYREINAPKGTLVIFEFSDFQCPYCKESQTTIKRIKDKYGDKIHVVFRHFPTGHEFSQLAAEAAECADDQGMFWPYHDMLFQNHILSNQDLLNFASNLGLDSEAFSACLISREKQQIVKNDFELARRLGIQGSLTFIIGDDQILGSQKYSKFESIVEEQLNKLGDGPDE